MNERERRVFVTGRKGNLELPAHFLANRIPQEIFEESMCIRRNIEGFVGVNARFIGGRHVSHGVAAGLADGNVVLF